MLINQPQRLLREWTVLWTDYVRLQGVVSFQRAECLRLLSSLQNQFIISCNSMKEKKILIKILYE